MASKFLLSLALLICCNILSAQLSERNRDLFIYDLTQPQYLNAATGIDQVWYSNGHNLSLMGEWMPSRSFGFGFGLGYTSENYHNNLRISTSQASGKEVYELLPDSAFSSISQNVKYLYLPLEIRIRGGKISKDWVFRLTLGARAGVRIGSEARYETEEVKLEYQNLGDLNRFRADLYARIGYGPFSLYASYGFTELYTGGTLTEAENGEIKQNQMSDIRPLALGISLSIQ